MTNKNFWNFLLFLSKIDSKEQNTILFDYSSSQKKSLFADLQIWGYLHCKKRLAVFPSPAGMSLTKLSLVGNNLIIPGQGEFGKWHPHLGRKTANLFYSVGHVLRILCTLSEESHTNLLNKKKPPNNKPIQAGETNGWYADSYLRTYLTKNGIPMLDNTR